MQPSFSHEYVNFLSFDTHKCIKELQQNFGFNEKQAEGVVKAIIESKDYDLSKLATRDQIVALGQEIAALEQKTEKRLLEVENRLLKWIIPMFCGVFASAIGTIVTILMKLH